MPDSKVESCLQRARLSFAQNLGPKLTAEGTSGAYIIKNATGPVAVFKPIDEEPFAPNNPRGMTGLFGSDTCRPSIKSGESTLREVAAYLIDHDGFSGVPATSLVQLQHKDLPMRPITKDQVLTKESLDLLNGLIDIKNGKGGKKVDFDTLSEASEESVATANSEVVEQTPKVGSLQCFVASEGPIENFSSDLFSNDEVHKIAVLDLRLLNLDRNTDNILVQRLGEDLTLVPIDHGLCMPDSLEVNTYDLAWLGYAQAEQPFSQRTLNYISSLNVDQDIAMIEARFNVRPICLRNMKISTLLLQRAAA